MQNLSLDRTHWWQTRSFYTSHLFRPCSRCKNYSISFDRRFSSFDPRYFLAIDNDGLDLFIFAEFAPPVLIREFKCIDQRSIIDLGIIREPDGGHGFGREQ